MEAAIHSVASHRANPYGGPSLAELQPTSKQMQFARRIAVAGKLVLPWEAQSSRRLLSRWIDENVSALRTAEQVVGHASSKQVAFAERIARIKRREVPAECFKDRQLMSRWIDRNRS